MDRRRIEFQIRAVVVAFRVEQRRQDPPTMEGFRARARMLLSELEHEVRPYPDLEARLQEARTELAHAERRRQEHDPSRMDAAPRASADR